MGNTELPAASFDIATCFYGFHEVPYKGRARILSEMHRVLVPGGYAAILDISPTFEPSNSMLAGEPYILEYQANISEQLKRVAGLNIYKTVDLVPGQVALWILQKQPQAISAQDARDYFSGEIFPEFFTGEMFAP